MRLNNDDLLLPKTEFNAVVKTKKMTDNEKDWLYSWVHYEQNLPNINDLGVIRKAHYDGWNSARMF